LAARRFPPPRPVEEQPACFVEPRNAITRLRSRKGGQQTRSRRPFPFQDVQAARHPCQLFCVLLRKLKQQWAELYCSDVGAGVKKDSGPYTFVYHGFHSQIALRSENITIKVCDPPSTGGGNIQVFNGGLNMRRDRSSDATGVLRGGVSQREPAAQHSTESSDRGCEVPTCAAPGGGDLTDGAG